MLDTVPVTDGWAKVGVPHEHNTKDTKGTKALFLNASAAEHLVGI
jgi:hypothetical protein